MITKILVFILMFSILIVLRELVDFGISVLVTGEKKMTNKRLLILALGVSYILTIIFTGLGL